MSDMLGPPSAVLPAVQQFDDLPRRINTGVAKFGADWPGVFIRGDAAMVYADRCRAMVAHFEREKRKRPEWLVGLAALFDAAQI